MNVSDFLSKADFESLLKMAKEQKPFTFERELKEHNNQYEFKLDGRFHNSWKNDTGEDYDVFLNFMYHSKDEGTGGWGGSIDYFTDYESFKERFNDSIKSFTDYDELEQISLF